METPQQEKKVFFDACADCYKRQKVLFSICKIVAKHFQKHFGHRVASVNDTSSGFILMSNSRYTQTKMDYEKWEEPQSVWKGRSGNFELFVEPVKALIYTINGVLQKVRPETTV